MLWPSSSPGGNHKKKTECNDPTYRCYDVCKTELKPIAPLCVASTPAPTATSTKLAECDNLKTTKATPTSIITSTVPTPTSPGCPAGKTGSGFMLCADYINACGMMYGGYVVSHLEPTNCSPQTTAGLDLDVG